MREREAPPHSREPQKHAAETPAKRRRWLRIALVLLALLVALVAFAPQILSTGFVKTFLFARAGARVGMRISTF
jgi:ferric-dicitrate binding protein FerR (iron transport regulator)